MYIEESVPQMQTSNERVDTSGDKSRHANPKAHLLHLLMNSPRRKGNNRGR